MTRPPNARWNAAERKYWRRLIAWLRESFPIPKPVAIRRVRYASDYGAAFPGPKAALIHIAGRLEFSDAVHTLFEEWAHLRDVYATRPDHGPTWALEYAAIREAWETEDV